MLALAVMGTLAAALSSCQPRTPAQKVEDAAEDAAHEAGQAVERSKENVNKAVK